MERKNSAGKMALSGTLAALAVVIMTLGGVIPLATYCCPILACVLLLPVLDECGRKIAWVWYAAVAVLSMLLSPDKEAAGVFLFLGYYPICKPGLDKLPKVLRWVCKVLLFNAAVVLLYALLIWAMGLDALAAEFREAGAVLLTVLLLMGNATFLLVDILLEKLTVFYQIKKRKK